MYIEWTVAHGGGGGGWGGVKRILLCNFYNNATFPCKIVRNFVILIQHVHVLTRVCVYESVCAHSCSCYLLLTISVCVYGLGLPPESRRVVWPLWHTAASLEHEIKFWPKGKEADHIHLLYT